MATVVAGCAAWSAPAWARKNGIGTQGCDGCHSGGQAPTVTLSATPMVPNVGQAVTVTVSISQTNGPVAGFYLTTEPQNVGTFKAVETGTLANLGGVTHTTPRTGSGGVTTFKVEWTTSVATGVQFAVYALSANGDGNARGDAGGSATLALVSGCTGVTYYLDQDGDGYGTSDPAYPIRKECTKPLNYAAVSGDCNDFNEKIHPGAPELCDQKDNNCDGKVDEAVVNQTYCEDKDGDGHGALGLATKVDCKPSMGFGDCNGDCNDALTSVYPGAIEVCDGRDNNCNGTVDEGVRKTCGVGWCRRYAEGCTAICTPGLPMVETCNYFDDDCDGEVDNGDDATLCGASGVTCVLGKCIPGSSSAGSGGASGGKGGATGTTGSGGSGARPNGSGGADSGGGNDGTGAAATGGDMGMGGGGGGCSTLPQDPEASVSLAALVLAGALWLARRRVAARAAATTRVPLSARHRPR
ncbi:MAG: putative metal-binding motif-containing protein [Bacteroidota bacterium]